MSNGLTETQARELELKIATAVSKLGPTERFDGPNFERIKVKINPSTRGVTLRVDAQEHENNAGRRGKPTFLWTSGVARLTGVIEGACRVAKPDLIEFGMERHGPGNLMFDNVNDLVAGLNKLNRQPGMEIKVPGNVAAAMERF